MKANEFEAITRNIAFERGVGLPGRVWASGAPAWIPDVVQDRNFPRARVAALEQLHGGVGSPIVLAGEVLGVIEFFSHDVKEPDEELLQVMSVIGSQIGQFIQRKEAEAELRSSREQLEAIFRSVAEGITVQDRTGRLVFANDAAAVFAGYPSAQAMLEASVDDLLAGFEIEDESGNPLTPEELPGRLALQGAGSHERVLRMRSLPHGQERWSMIRATPVFDDRGRVRFAVSVFHDITTQKREEEAQRFLSEAGELLAASVLNYEETLAGLAELAVPRLADWCAIHLRQEHGSLRQISVAHVDQSMVDLAEEMGRRYPPDPHAPRGVGRVVRTGRSEIYPEISDEMLVGAAQDTDQLSMLRGLGLRSGMVVPLAARGRILGAMTFVSAKSGRAYGPADLALAEELARRAALAVDNAMAYAERDHIARTLQQSLLPPDLPKIPGMEIASRYRAAGEGKEVGGDFYDVFPTGDRGWAIVIGDVCGKGPEAAAVTGLARYTIRATAMQERKPSNILLALNEAVLQQRSDYMFCTVAYARVRLNPDKARVTICCAGHPLPMLLRADGTVETVGTPGTLLGVFPDPQLKDRPVDLGPGDSLVLFTDGVVEEHVGRRVFGRAGLASLLESSAGQTAERIADAIDRAVIEFSPGVPRDDIAVLVLRKKA